MSLSVPPNPVERACHISRLVAKGTYCRYSLRVCVWSRQKSARATVRYRVRDARHRVGLFTLRISKRNMLKTVLPEPPPPKASAAATEGWSGRWCRAAAIVHRWEHARGSESDLCQSSCASGIRAMGWHDGVEWQLRSSAGSCSFRARSVRGIARCAQRALPHRPCQIDYDLHSIDRPSRALFGVRSSKTTKNCKLAGTCAFKRSRRVRGR